MRTLIILGAVILMAAVAPAADKHHDHGHGGHADEGPAHGLGEIALAGTTFTVALHGKIEAGKEAVLSIAIAKGPKASEVRSWVGVQNGRGSVKALLPADEHGHFHGHLEVPATLPDGSAIWLEMAGAAGPERGSLPLPAKDHAHEDDHDEDHAGHDHGSSHDDHDDHAGHGH